MDELALLAAADRRALEYTRSLPARRVFPDAEAIVGLKRFDEPLPLDGYPPEHTLAMLDNVGSPATTASNGADYYGFVIGAALPVASAAERLMIAWDQCASGWDNSPVSATLERQAARWLLEILDLPRESAVGFGTSATACTLSCLATARRELLKQQGWDFDQDGLIGAPEIRVVVSALAHITVIKALRVLGFGLRHLLIAPVNERGQVDIERLPELNDRTILCLQAGEVNSGEFDDFAQLIPLAKAAGSWVHVDGAFGLWARASSLNELTSGIELADSWTTDAHKWLNTPYDCAMAICRHASALSATLRGDAVYSAAAEDAQKNLTLEFSRRPRGIPVWAALRSLGRTGVAEMVERHCRLAKRVAEGLSCSGYQVLNRVVLNQVLFRADDQQQTLRIRDAVQASGETWFAATQWQGQPALRISISSWRTEDANIDHLLLLLNRIKRSDAVE
ncbi:pyridoxal phosphate-dependent decarboxylase family protein [Pantoea coffeiphila]|uniref:Aspartate aminotransferase family protein n=1 Tax=Pantoea coffeiphila TaxID=1465635 RepID=A0A2S9IEN7_9GAMM|nr:pyridoxal-dependent decarboxylase [Pantoea coffeiphila]PRD16252.1 aspartate aminotransferase family protein [Pantoea coffeiphila]